MQGWKGGEAGRRGPGDPSGVNDGAGGGEQEGHPRLTWKISSAGQDVVFSRS